MRKRCPCCHEWKPSEEFPRNKRTKDGLATYCKPCHNAKGRASRERNGGPRHYHLMRRYGISAARATEMFEAQSGLCAICRVEPAAHVDHDHISGAVRGLLCFKCNGGLGQFGDDMLILGSAIAYLEAHDPDVEFLAERTRQRLAALGN